eukprot:8708995-Prorocentrum_lima.AAC.1
MEGVYVEVHKVKYQPMIAALKMALWLLPKVNNSQDQWRSIRMDCWDMGLSLWLDSSGHSCQCHMKILRETKGVSHG